MHVDLTALSIVGGDTVCTTNLSASGAVQENDVITMMCSITYSGNWAPVMRWFNSVTSRDFTDDVITLTTNETVTSKLTVTSSAGLHGSKINCVVYFTSPTSAANVPSYTYTWTSPILNVQCKCSSRQWLSTVILQRKCRLAMSLTIVLIVFCCLIHGLDAMHSAKNSLAIVCVSVFWAIHWMSRPRPRPRHKTVSGLYC